MSIWNVVDAHKILSLLMYWLMERKKWPGEVTRAFNTTKMVDRIAAAYGRKLNEHGIGFKYHVVDLMLEKEILIGGEFRGVGNDATGMVCWNALALAVTM